MDDAGRRLLKPIASYLNRIMFLQKLSILDNPLVEDYILPDQIFHKRNVYFPISKEMINSDALSLFDNLGLVIGGVIVFRKPPLGKSPVHTDVLLTTDGWTVWKSAVNFNLTNSTAEMTWYETALEPSVPPPQKLRNQTNYRLSGIHYGRRENKDLSNGDFKILHEESIYTPAIVATDIPHSVVNLSSEERVCISIRFKENYSFLELKEKFKNYLV